MTEIKEGNYLITGATGFLGGILIQKLRESEEFRKGKLKILALVRDKKKAKHIWRDEEGSSFILLQADIRDSQKLFSEIPGPVDYLIHCASVTQSSEMIGQPVETADSVVLGSRNMLALAVWLQVKSMVFLSSMEIYGTVENAVRRRTESELGELDLESVRSCYSMGKRMAEHYCHIYWHEYRLPVKIARLAQIFGKGAREEDNRVYAQFARAVKQGRDIILKTSGKSMGNYCDSDEAAEGIMLILEKGVNGEVYNVVNEENTMQIREMAELVAREVAGGKIKVRIEQEPMEKTGYAPDTGLKLSGEKLRRLGWQPKKGLVQMYKDMLEEMCER